MSKIYCFSTTGNSLYVANGIAKNINAEVVSMTKKITSCNDEVIGFVFPVYFWGLPITVENFINSLNITNKSAYVFVIVTFGGFALSVDAVLNKILKSKEVELSYSNKIKCIENYIPSFKVNDDNFNWQSIDDKISKISKNITTKTKKKIINFTILNSIIHSMFPAKNPTCDKNFIVSDKCTHCGLCAKICPKDNITIINEKVYFNNNCEHCLGCLNVCPQNAIDYKNYTQGKKRYKNNHIKINELIKLNE